MTRFLIFAALGPPIGALVILAASLVAWPLVMGHRIVVPNLWNSKSMVMLTYWFMFSYMLGLVPALVAWLADALAAKRGFLQRLLGTMLAGAFGGGAYSLVVAVVQRPPGITASELKSAEMIVIVSIISAAICSVLAHLGDRMWGRFAPGSGDGAECGLAE